MFATNLSAEQWLETPEIYLLRPLSTESTAFDRNRLLPRTPTMQNITLRADTASKVLAARRIRHLSQDEVASHLEVSKAWLARVENGKVSVREHLFQCLCSLLQLNWLELVEPTPTITSGKRVRKKPVPATSEREATASDSLVDLFFAVPMDALGEGYDGSRADILTLLDDIRTKYRATKVFCAVEGRASKADFDDEAIALRSNLAVLKHSAGVLAIIPERAVTSVLVEIGAALAFGKPVVVLFRNRADLPFLIRNTALDPLLTTIKYNDGGQLRTLLSEAIRVLKPKDGWLASG